jgi:hypothetical protein
MHQTKSGAGNRMPMTPSRDLPRPARAKAIT